MSCLAFSNSSFFSSSVPGPYRNLQAHPCNFLMSLSEIIFEANHLVWENYCTHWTHQGWTLTRLVSKNQNILLIAFQKAMMHCGSSVSFAMTYHLLKAKYKYNFCIWRILMSGPSAWYGPWGSRRGRRIHRSSTRSGEQAALWHCQAQSCCLEEMCRFNVGRVHKK